MMFPEFKFAKRLQLVFSLVCELRFTRQRSHKFGNVSPLLPVVNGRENCCFFWQLQFFGHQFFFVTFLVNYRLFNNFLKIKFLFCFQFLFRIPIYLDIWTPRVVLASVNFLVTREERISGVRQDSHRIFLCQQVTRKTKHCVNQETHAC